jgi:hypothetical protein
MRDLFYQLGEITNKEAIIIVASDDERPNRPTQSGTESQAGSYRGNHHNRENVPPHLSQVPH